MPVLAAAPRAWFGFGSEMSRVVFGRGKFGGGNVVAVPAA